MSFCDNEDLNTSNSLKDETKLPPFSECVGNDSIVTVSEFSNGDQSSDDSNIPKITQNCAFNFESLNKELELIKESYKSLQFDHGNLQKLHSECAARFNNLDTSSKAAQKELKDMKELLASHDAAAKRAVTSLQNELRNRCDSLVKQLTDNKREKESLVLKFAQSEAENLKVQKVAKEHEGRLREAVREKEAILTRARAIKAERDKLASALESRTAEASNAVAELQHFKDEHSSDDVRAKWAEDRLREESESHKDTKKKLELAREETETIRRNCAEIVKKYQESEEIKSNSLDVKLKQTVQQLEEQRHQQSDAREVNEKMQRELDTIKIQLKEAASENKTLKDRLRCLEAERLCQEEALSQSKEAVLRANREIDHLRAQGRLCQSARDEAADLRQRLAEEEIATSEADAKCQELEQEREALRRKETELLEFTQRVSDRHAALQADSLTLASQLENANQELDLSKKSVEQLQRQLSELESRSSSAESKRRAELERLNSRVVEKTHAVEELSVQLEDERNEVRTLKKKHAALVKDLTRQLAQTRKKLDAKSGSGVAADTLSAGSRASSTSSLEQVNGAHLHQHHQQHQQQYQQHQQQLQQSSQQHQHEEVTAAPSCGVTSPTRTGRNAATEMSCDFTPEIKLVEPDRQALIEKIVKLQKDRGRKNEKIDFLQEHVRQLTEEVQKKNRLLQCYLLREEAGSIAPETVDIHKAVLARKGGIMASMYSATSPQCPDQSLTLPISLEINRKLQAVLEDTILKNMTLKDNMTTLGEEIARLSQENRKLQLDGNSTSDCVT